MYPFVELERKHDVWNLRRWPVGLSTAQIIASGHRRSLFQWYFMFELDKY